MSVRLMLAGLAMVAAVSPAFAQQGSPDALFAAWDKDKNGALSKDEFRAGYDGVRTAMATQRLRAEFQRHDADKSGKLEAGEYAKLVLVQRAGKNAPMLSAFDRDKNQGLDFQEYLDFVRTATKAQAAAPATPSNKKGS